MKKRECRFLAADFETTVYDEQEYTEVWASTSCELYTEDVKIFHSLKEQFDYFLSMKSHLVVYFHNLKFDGSFWLPFLMQEMKLSQAFIMLSQDPLRIEWLEDKDMPNNSFKYSVSDRGQWYTITIKYKGIIIEIRDSLKLLPFSLKRAGESFKTKHRKLEMEYKGFRYAGCAITEDEQEYIKNDCLVLKELLEHMFDDNHKELTIGACCLKEFKKIYGKEDYNMFFPNQYEIELEENKFIYKLENGEVSFYKTAGDYVRKSYKGGWCYVVNGKESKIFYLGLTADVNSLYPSMMHSESGNRYPVGNPNFWVGDYIPEEAKASNKYYFVRIKTRFYLKKNYLPFIHIKNSFLYDGTENLETSDIYDRETELYYNKYTKAGIEYDTRVELTLTMTDYELLKEHYHLIDCEILDGCWYFSEIGLFDEYIDKYKEIKINSKGAVKESAKLFLNNLYGKFASSTESSFKVAFVKENGALYFKTVVEHNKKPGYIPVGSAITSYSRNFTIRTAQKNYFGADKPGFAYADTDSIHCNDITPSQLVGVKLHDNDFCCWKLEAEWDKAIFTRQKHI